MEEGGHTWRGDEGEDAEAGGGEEVFRLEDAVDLIFDTRGHLHNRNDRYLSTATELYHIYKWAAENALLFSRKWEQKTTQVVYNVIFASVLLFS